MYVLRKRAGGPLRPSGWLKTLVCTHLRLRSIGHRRYSPTMINRGCRITSTLLLNYSRNIYNALQCPLPFSGTTLWAGLTTASILSHWHLRPISSLELPPYPPSFLVPRFSSSRIEKGVDLQKVQELGSDAIQSRGPVKRFCGSPSLSASPAAHIRSVGVLESSPLLDACSSDWYSGPRRYCSYLG